jgi:hypothetical protein
LGNQLATPLLLLLLLAVGEVAGAPIALLLLLPSLLLLLLLVVCFSASCLRRSSNFSTHLQASTWAVQITSAHVIKLPAVYRAI